MQTLPCAVDATIDLTANPAFVPLLGHYFVGFHGYIYRFVKAASAIGSSSATALYARGKALKWSDQAAFSVVGGAANTDPVCGVLSAAYTGTIPGLPKAGPVSVGSGEGFLMQVSGRYLGIIGSTASDQADAGEYVFCSTDADTGKLDDGGATQGDTRITFGVALETSAVADANVVVALLGMLS